MVEVVKNIKQALIEISPEFMTLLDVDTTEKKEPGIGGGLKYIAWISIWNFRITNRNTVTEFAKIQFQPNTTGLYDTEDEAMAAGWEFINMLTSTKWIFTTIWNEWATE